MKYVVIGTTIIHGIGKKAQIHKPGSIIDVSEKEAEKLKRHLEAIPGAGSTPPPEEPEEPGPPEEPIETPLTIQL